MQQHNMIFFFFDFIFIFISSPFVYSIVREFCRLRLCFSVLLHSSEHIQQKIPYHVQSHGNENISAFQKSYTEYDTQNDDINKTEVKKSISQYALHGPSRDMYCHEHQ